MNRFHPRLLLGSLFPLLLFQSNNEIATSADAWAYELSTFSAEVTVPLGHALMGGGIAPASEVVDPLFAHGLILFGARDPIVFLAVDWCEIRNDAYDRWRTALAEAAGTVPQRVILASVHQHDAPVADLGAQRLLDAVGLPKSLCDAEFHERSVQRVAQAAKESLSSKRKVTHFGIGQARVEKVASNRRVLFPYGKVSFPRNSATTDPEVRAAPEGIIDPWLKTLSFWDGDRPVAAISSYAVHPMSYYGKGGVSFDFVGMARERRRADLPGVQQIYFSGCGGDVTAGKFNDGSPENRPVLADRIYQAMKAAWESTEKHPLEEVSFRCVELRLPPRRSGEYAVEALEATLGDESQNTFQRNLAAMGLAWIKRVEEGRAIEVPAVDLGAAQFLLLPAEAFVQYQLDAQAAAPEDFVVVAGYGESAPGYVPSLEAEEEGFIETHSWCWVERGAWAPMGAAIERAITRAK